MTRRVLVLSPHFPPDFSAGAHRARLLAPHLPAFGWMPTVITVEPGAYDAALDPDLQALASGGFDIERVSAWPSRATRWLGFRDLGLRALMPLRSACRRACERLPMDVVYVTIYPTYPALIGPWLKRTFGVRFVLDLQDPWVGSWGLTTGPDGHPDLRSRLSRQLALRLERRVVRDVDGLTSVSRGTLAELQARVPRARDVPSEELPIGWDPRDWLMAQRQGSIDAHRPGTRTFVYVGTILPAGREILRGFLRGVRRWRDRRRSDASMPIRLLFVGSSNQSRGNLRPVVEPIAAEEGVADLIEEHPARVAYLDALRLTATADAVLVLGTTEPHYTPSKMFTALAAERPVLAVLHKASAAATMMEPLTEEPGLALLTLDGPVDLDRLAQEVASRLELLVAPGERRPFTKGRKALETFRADALAARLARLFDRVVQEQGA